MKVTAQQLWFTGARQVDIREQQLRSPAADEIVVEVICSAVSAGTEMLVYRGQIPDDITLDANIESLQSQQYPLQYGYAAVGKIISIGNTVDEAWLDQLVFAFQPHASHFVTSLNNVIPVPSSVQPEDAVFLANMETAINLMHDGKPIFGERVLVLGQGIVGLLLTSLLAKMPLLELIVADTFALRRDAANKLGARAFDPTDIAERNKEHDRIQQVSGADLIFELTGVPDALNLAIDLSGFHSRVVVGSWYGTKSAPVYLGGAAHRNRLQIITSQVSTIAPELSGRWSKERRFLLAWDMIRRVRPSQFISTRYALHEAAVLYEQLDKCPGAQVQALLVYP